MLIKKRPGMLAALVLNVFFGTLPDGKMSKLSELRATT
jgi:hypothetical protein